MADTEEEIKQRVLDMVEAGLGAKLVFKPKKNMSCSFSCMVKKPAELNPCPDCGGTRLYEWEKFQKEHGFSPDQIEGYNLNRTHTGEVIERLRTSSRPTGSAVRTEVKQDNGGTQHETSK